MQRLEVSGAVRLIYKALAVKGLNSAVHCPRWFLSHGFAEAAEHAVGVRADSSAVKMCTQAVMPNAQSKFCNCLSSRPVWYFGFFLASMVYGRALSLVHVCIHFGTAVLSVV